MAVSKKCGCPGRFVNTRHIAHNARGMGLCKLLANDFGEPSLGVAHYPGNVSQPKRQISIVGSAPAVVRSEPYPVLNEDEPPLEGRSDDELMLLARGGVERAFEVLVRRHQTTALSVAARLLGRSAGAADVVQNTFLAIYSTLPSYQPRGKFSAYLYQILVNQCRMAHRSLRVERNALAVIDSHPLEHGDSVESTILARERQREVELALGRISDKLRDVVVLRYTGGLSHEEIAAVLTLPVGTVKRRLFDAMARLRTAMGEA